MSIFKPFSTTDLSRPGRIEQATETLDASAGTTLNDVHSRLNPTEVAEYHEPTTRDEIIGLVRRAREMQLAISISGGRHAMGGQQFGHGTLHVDLSNYRKVVAFDRERGLVTVESGIQWPELIDWLIAHQPADRPAWGIRQKQTGADRLSIGGALSANIHGRGLNLAPMVGDVEAFELITADGRVLRCSREENRELFSLAIGGYGLFGIFTEVTLRLSRRTKLRRDVVVVDVDAVPGLVEQRIADGYLYGDFQFKTDDKAADFLRTGVFSFYRPVPPDTPLPETQESLSAERWNELYLLAHTDKARAYDLYSTYYLGTDGQLYWSDTHQLSYYVEGLDPRVDRELGARAPGSLVICEFYVPRAALPDFLAATATVIRERDANLVYGTVRYIEPDHESYLAWARERFATVVMNLRVTHDEAGIRQARTQFREIIDAALALGGSYYLTYHRWARKDQVLAAYPQFVDFLRLKLKHDPEERFQSDWYRHYRAMFAGEL